MAITEYKSSTSLTVIEKTDLDELRAAMKGVYERMGGEHSLSESSHHVYENLDGYFKSRLQQLEVRVYTVADKRTKERSNPDPSFLRDLFYAKVQEQKMKCRQYNFDLAYYFAFSISRQQYMANKRAKDGVTSLNPELKVLISSMSQYFKETDNIKNYLEMKIGRIVEKDIRDIKAESIGALLPFHANKSNLQTPVIYLLGKFHFLNEDFILDFIHLKNEIGSKFKVNVRIIFLDDLWEGEYNINNSAGVVRIIEHWLSHIEFMDAQAKKRKGKKISPEHKELSKKANADIHRSKIKTKLIIQKIPALVEFLLTEVQSVPYSYFMNSASKDFVHKWLSAGNEEQATDVKLVKEQPNNSKKSA